MIHPHDTGETDGLQANKAIQQNILVMREHEKLENMFQIIDSIKGENNDNRSMPKILVFTSRKVDFGITMQIIMPY